MIMNTSDTISVIIPTFNRRQLLERALTSVVNQTWAADEILCIDDGSTDETGHMVREKFPQVRYYRQTNKGISAARNRGIKQSKGTWLAFLDSDDSWHPSKLAAQTAALAAAPGHVICYTNETWIRNGKQVNPKKIHRKYGGKIYDKCLPLCIISPSSVVIHRTVFTKIGLFDESLPVCEDYDLWLRVCAQYPVLYLEEPLMTKYGGHADQLSRKYWGMDRYRIMALEKMIQTRTLPEVHRQKTLRELINKVDIYLSGARKRKKYEDISLYETKKKTYLNLLKAD
jgi:glycosyltransferase involved in cell wall biosynthesis